MGSVSFPVPDVAPPTQVKDFYGPDHPHRRTQPSYPSAGDNSLPDPYLEARYQTPLPLPPGASSPSSRARQAVSLPEDTSRIQALRAAEEEAARRKRQEDEDAELARKLDMESDSLPPPPVRKPVEDARTKALRLAEEDAARRKAQEDKDAELARQLDRELNLQEQATHTADRRKPSGPPMPGGWRK